MSFIKYRVRVLEPFKDGNILEGRELKPEQVVILDESDFTKIVNSGGMLEVIETLVPNPLKKFEAEVPPVSTDPIPVEPDDLPLLVEEEEKPVKKTKASKKAGLVRGQRAKK